MDTIVVLDDGKIADTGSYHEVLVQSADLVQQAEATLEIGSETVKESTRVQSEEDDSGDQAPPPPPPAEEPMTAQQDNLARQQGSWSVYRYYYQSAGAISVFFWAFFTLLGAVSINIMREFLDSVALLACSPLLMGCSVVDREVDERERRGTKPKTGSLSWCLCRVSRGLGCWLGGRVLVSFEPLLYYVS